MATRTAEELQALKDGYNSTTYIPYADAEREAGREPQSFDEAFQAHLEALDAETAGKAGADAAPAAGAKATGGGKRGGGKASTAKAGAAKKAGGGKAATPAKADAPKTKTPAAPKAKAFRPTSADRTTINAAAQKVLGKDGKGKNHRVKVVEGKTERPYADFLQGKVIKMDAQGNGSATLNVYTAADDKTLRGTIAITVKKGAMTATGKKA